MTNAAVAVTNQDVVSAIQSTSDSAQRDERITTILLSGNGPIGAVTHNICRALLPFLSDHGHQEWRDDKGESIPLPRQYYNHAVSRLTALAREADHVCSDGAGTVDWIGKLMCVFRVIVTGDFTKA